MLVSPPMMEKLDDYMEMAYITQAKQPADCTDNIILPNADICRCAKPITNRDKHYYECTAYNDISNIPPYYECLCDHIDDERNKQ